MNMKDSDDKPVSYYKPAYSELHVKHQFLLPDGKVSIAARTKSNFIEYKIRSKE